MVIDTPPLQLAKIKLYLEREIFEMKARIVDTMILVVGIVLFAILSNYVKLSLTFSLVAMVVVIVILEMIKEFLFNKQK